MTSSRSRSNPVKVLKGAAIQSLPRRVGASPRRVAASAGQGASGAMHATALGAASSPAATPDPDFARGYDAGFAQGLQAAQAKSDEALRAARDEFERTARARMQAFQTDAQARLAQIERLRDGLGAALDRRLQALEGDAAALALAAVVRLLGETAGRSTAVLDIVRAGLERLRGATLLRVRMHEADLRALTSDPAGRALCEQWPQVRWLADAGVTAGGCLFDTVGGTTDARLDTQLELLRAAWRRAGFDVDGESA